MFPLLLFHTFAHIHTKKKQQQPLIRARIFDIRDNEPYRMNVRIIRERPIKFGCKMKRTIRYNATRTVSWWYYSAMGVFSYSSTEACLYIFFLNSQEITYGKRETERESEKKKCAASGLNYGNHKNRFYDVFIGTTALDSRQKLGE